MDETMDFTELNEDRNTFSIRGYFTNPLFDPQTTRNSKCQSLTTDFNANNT